MKDKRNIIIALIISIVFMGGTISFAYFLMEVTGTGSNTSKLVTGTLKLNINDTSINIDNLPPVDDKDYKEYAYKKEFEIINSGTLNGCTSIYLDINGISESLKSEYFKYKVVSNTNIYTGDFSEIDNNRLMFANESMIEAGTTKKYTLYIWISYDKNIDQTNMLGTTLTGTLSIESKDCKSVTYDFETVALYVNNTKVEELNDNMGYELESYICKNGEKVTYDNTRRAITVEPIKKETSCSLYFNKYYEKEFAYTGSYQEFVTPDDGYYKIELWGAQGGRATSLGGYSSGVINLNKGEKIYFYVGAEGINTINIKRFNSGTGNSGGNNGGGATDIRYFEDNPASSDLEWDSQLGLNSRIMVAGGSGSGAGNNTIEKGAGGGLIANSSATKGGTQITYGDAQGPKYTVSEFGIANGGCTGGNGYYPGGGATCAEGAGGGSSFISGYAGVNAIVKDSTANPREHANETIHYSRKYFIDGKMERGINSGAGKAKVTYIGKKPERINFKLNNIRYVKDCMSGNTVNDDNHWVELQVIKDGVNLAKDKIVSGVTNVTANPLTRITDGDITSANWASGGTGTACITLDLEANYDIDEIAVWHYWSGERTYYENITYVSSDNNNFIEVINKQEVETSQGKRVSAYSN